MPSRYLSVLAMAASTSLATAQFTVVIPNTPSPMATTEGNTSNAFPWGRGGAGIRIQNIYDSSHFTSQGITYPILISGLKWRLNGNGTSLASTQSTGSTVELSTCPVDQSAATTSFAANRGPDLTTCWSGVMSWPAQTATPGPTPFSIDTPFQTNFLYDPNLGDLNIETDIPVQTFTGTAVQLDVQSTGSLACRVYLTTGYPTAAPLVNLNHGVVVEITYVPATGLHPAFTATPRSGPLGQQVNFTDQSYTSDPGGILSWAWDVNGDAVTDYTTQNCTHTYNTEGNYNVSLTVISAQFGSQTRTVNNYITIDAVDASFSAAINPGALVIFTDTSTGNPTTWAWDFQNDGIVDSTTQNTAFVYPGPGAYTCRLTVTDAFSNDTTTTTLGIGIIPQPNFGSTFTSTVATRGFWFQTPTRFSIISASVPDETNNGTQNVAIYRLAGAPPVYAATATGGLEFVATGQPSNANIPCVVSFDAGEYVGVLGACGTTTMYNSYGTPAGPVPSSVLGQPCTLTRFGTQFNLNTTAGTTAYWQEPAGAISRVILGVTAAAGIPYGTGTQSGAGPAAPTLKCTALPYIGQTATLEVTQNDNGVLSFMVAGFGRAALPSPFGTVLVNNIVATSVMNGAAVVGPGSYPYSFTIPNDPSFVGLGINWQNANLVVASGQVSLSSAVETWLDL